MRLIDADVLLKEWRLECGGSCFIRKDKYCMHYDRTKGVCTLIIKAPTVEPTKHGTWGENIYGYRKCSVCGRVTQVDECMREPLYLYCPYCGAKMDEEELEARNERL